MCLAMNPDKLAPGERCASTSNRNFEGRQGNGGRTHLVSPQMAAAAAIKGTLTDIREFGVPVVEVPETDTLPKSEYSGVVRKKATSKASQTLAKSAGMPKFTTLKGVAAPLDIQNIDTDMIIPKQYLKTIKRTGLGKHLFAEMRYDDDGKEKPDFVLNKPQYRGAQVLVAEDNFGCGSSREHAPWALLDFGIRCVISTSFADIFYNNCFKNGILPIVLPQEAVDVLMKDAEKGSNARIEVDLEAQTVTSSDGQSFKFDVDAFKKHCLLNGLDDIGLTMEKAKSIDNFEAKAAMERPWV